MKNYATYKASGIEWLDDTSTTLSAGIPEHWQVKRIKDYVDVNIKSLGSDTDSEFEIKYLDISNVNNTRVTGEMQDLKFYEAPSRARRIVYNGDTIMSTVRPYLMAIAYLENISENMIASTGFAVMTPKKSFSSKYLFYITVSHWFNETVNSKSVGASYPALNNDVLVSTKILSPPKEEQTTIAHYLDEKTTKLDQLIKNKKAQIAQLKEVRQIEINTAVTKGLDPKVKLKPSGVEWLGDIPEHWEVKRIKDYVNVNIASLGSDTDPELEIKYLDISNVNVAGVTGDVQELKYHEAPSRAKRIVQNGDVVMSTVRPYLKAIAYLEDIPENMIASTGFAVMTSKSSFNSKYLFYKTVSDWFNETVNSKSVGASYPALNNDVLIASKILVPPKKEQIAIANYLDEKTSKLDHLVSNLENQIEQLQEVRKIEIFNAVTGKIKVV